MARGRLPTLVEPQVAPRGVQTRLDVQVPAGVGLGKGLAALGNAAADIAVAEKKKADAYAATAADLEFSKEASKIFTDFKAQKGYNALDPLTPFAKIEELRAKREAQLANEDQVAHFNTLTRARTEHWFQAMNEHSNVQGEVYKTAVASGAMEDAKSEIGIFFDKPAVVADKIEKALPFVEERAGAAGVPVGPERARAIRVLVEASLDGFEGAGRAEAGLKWMDSALPKLMNADGTPMTVRQALGARVGHWEGKFRDAANTQKAIRTVETMLDEDQAGALQDPSTKQIKEADVTDRLREKWKAGEVDESVFKKAIEHTRLLNTIYREGYIQERSRLVGQAWPLFEKYHTVASIKAADGGVLWSKLQQGPEAHHFEQLEESWSTKKYSDPPTPSQLRNAVQFAIDLATKPHMFDGWDADRYYKEVGIKLHPKDVETLGKSLAMVQGRPDKLAGLMGPLIDLYNKLGGAAGAFPNMHDPTHPENKTIDNWKSDADRQVYMAGLNLLQQRLLEWRADDKNKRLDRVPAEELQTWVQELVQKGRDRNGWFGVATPGSSRVGESTTSRLRAQTLGTGFHVTDIREVPINLRNRIEKGLKDRGQPADAAQVLKEYNEIYGVPVPANPAATTRPGDTGFNAPDDNSSLFSGE